MRGRVHFDRIGWYADLNEFGEQELRPARVELGLPQEQIGA